MARTCSPSTDITESTGPPGASLIPAFLPPSTERLRFRGFLGEDASWIAPYWGADAYRRTLREERPATVAAIRSLMRRRAAAGDLDFLFEDARSGCRVGRASIQRIGNGLAEVEIEVPAHALRRQGYGSEALASILAFAHGRLHLTRLVAKIASGNEASVALARKQGFRFWRKALALPGMNSVLFYIRDLGADNSAR